MGKLAFHRIADMPYEDALGYMHAQLSLNLLTEDAMEGVGAFLQRREPSWKGR
jgi:enoyl-CoA hydratase/carnithine racemase